MLKRNFEFPLEVRAQEDQPVLAGYAAVFAPALSLDLGGFREQIAPGAFTRTLQDQNNDIVALWSHDWSMPLGRRSAGTLSLNEDERGLAVEIRPDQTSWSRNAVEAVRSGSVKGMSFGFLVEDDSWDRQTKVRTLNQVRLAEVSLCVMPAYPDTEAEIRSALSEIESSFAAQCTDSRGNSLRTAMRHLQLLRLRG